MEKYIRLAFRIVVLGFDAANVQELLRQIKTMISPIGLFYDFSSNPYPKVSGSNMVRIEFDVPIPFESGLEKVVELLGGSGWHIVNDDDEQVAIWAAGDGLSRPLGDYFHWGEIQLIPFNQLAASRRLSRPENDAR